MDEQLLIAACKKGKSSAFKSLYELYAPAMMGVCLRYISDKEAARDVFQDAFVKTFTKIESYEGSGAFGGWIRRIFVTTALEHIRKKDVLSESLNIDEISEYTENAEMSVYSQISEDEIKMCIDMLPPACKAIFNLYVIDGYSHDEIANLLHIQKSTSHRQLSVARKLLQTRINELLLTNNARRKTI